MENKHVIQNEKAVYEPPLLEVVEVKMERNFASTGRYSIAEPNTIGQTNGGIQGYKTDTW